MNCVLLVFNHVCNIFRPLLEIRDLGVLYPISMDFCIFLVTCKNCRSAICVSVALLLYSYIDVLRNQLLLEKDFALI